MGRSAATSLSRTSGAGAYLTPSFSPYGRICQVPVDEVFGAVRYLMFRWGFINCFRVDNGAPFGEPTRQALSPLHLRLCASGILVQLNPARSPKSNAKVERSQGTTSRWAEPCKCANCLELQQRLDEVAEAQRELLRTRACNGMTRAERYPALLSNHKRFHPGDFEVRRVYRLLSKGTWQRKVSAQGSTEVFGKAYQVGYKYRGQEIDVKFDAESVSWHFKAKNGELLKTIQADNLGETNILALSYCQ